MIERIAGAIALQWGWRRLALAFAAGGLAAFAQAPYHAFPVLWISLPVLVWLIDGIVDGGGGRRLGDLLPAFRIGWMFGFGYFLNGLWWIGEAFLVDAKQYAWAMPFAVVLLPAGLALFTGVAIAAARAAWTTGASRIAVLAVAWTILEYGRGHLFTGFPWNDLGYGLAATPALMQAASLVGLPGLTLPAVLIFAAPAALDGTRGGGRFVFGAGLLMAAIFGFGVMRLNGAGHDMVPGVKLRVMQPAITEWSKWQPDARADVLAGYIDLSSTGPNGLRSDLTGVTVLVWPESPFGFLLAREPWALSAIADLLRSGPTTLITGAVRSEPPEAGETRPRFYNAIYIFGPNGEISGAYDKSHLVPFGEYVPFQSLFDLIGVTQLTQVKSAFSRGPGPRTMPIPGAPPAGMTICYEAVFPGAIVDPANRPGWIVNVTDDSWFGMSPGPYQHLHQVQLRAVEEGLPVVRSANTGISAVIDPYGRIVTSLALGKAGIFESGLPVGLDPSLYVQLRDACVLIELIVTSLLIASVNLTRKR